MTERQSLVIRDTNAEIKRQHAINRKTARAYIALQPCLETLAIGHNEWVDTPGLFEEQKKTTWVRNEFVIEGDANTTYRKALKYLLEKRGNSMRKISEMILYGGKDHDANPIAIQTVEAYLSGLLNEDPRR